MNIILNNSKEEIPFSDQITVEELLKYKKFSFKLLIVKVNDKLIKKDEFSKSIIKEGDTVDVIHLISGG
jgi:thiamine biosynthesis protein ThiS